MIYELTATITHKTFAEPIIHKLRYEGKTFDDILDQLNTLPWHNWNLIKFKRTSFRDSRGVKHSWKLKEIKDENHNKGSEIA
jgi:hypothetical protein